MLTGGPGRGQDRDETTVVLDPRMRQRREQVIEEETRRRRNRLLWAAVPLLAVAVLLVLSRTSLADVDRVEVVGAGRTSTEAVVEASGIQRGHRMLTLDEKGAARRVEALPWILEARVIREWPSGVRIAVTERVPAAAVLGGEPGAEELGWVDETGRVLQVGGQVAGAEDLVTLIGLEEVPPPGAELPGTAGDALTIAARARERVPGVLATVSLDLEGVLAETAPGAGAVVLFRSGDEVDEKLVALDTVLTKGDVRCLATVDLWVPDVPTVTRRPGCSAW